MRLLCSAPRRQDGGPRGLARRPLDAYRPQRYYSTRAAHVRIDILYLHCVRRAVGDGIDKGGRVHKSVGPDPVPGFRVPGVGGRAGLAAWAEGASFAGTVRAPNALLRLRLCGLWSSAPPDLSENFSRIRPPPRKFKRPREVGYNTRARNPRDTVSSLAVPVPSSRRPDSRNYFRTPKPPVSHVRFRVLRVVVHKSRTNINTITRCLRLYFDFFFFQPRRRRPSKIREIGGAFGFVGVSARREQTQMYRMLGLSRFSPVPATKAKKLFFLRSFFVFFFSLYESNDTQSIRVTHSAECVLILGTM